MMKTVWATPSTEYGKKNYETNYTYIDILFI